MKLGAIFSNDNRKKEDKIKKEKARKDMSHQLLEANVHLQALKKKYKIMIQQDVNQIKYSQAHKQDNPKAVQHLKNSYYCLSVVQQAEERLYDITSEHELCQSINEMGQILKTINGFNGKSEKIKLRLINKGCSNMKKSEVRGGQAMEAVFGSSIDELVDDTIVDELLKGARVEDCLENSEGILYGANEIEPMNVEDIIGSNPDNLDAAIADINELMKDL